MTRVAINGLGRIGRATLKILMDTEGLDLVAANDIGAADDIAYLLKYDTVYGRYDKTVEVTSDAGLSIGGRRLTLLCEKDPARLPWKSLDVDILFVVAFPEVGGLHHRYDRRAARRAQSIVDSMLTVRLRVCRGAAVRLASLQGDHIRHGIRSRGIGAVPRRFGEGQTNPDSRSLALTPGVPRGRIAQSLKIRRAAAGLHVWPVGRFTPGSAP